MTALHPKKPREFSPADYPALRSFLRGYFHQDMKDEYGSPEDAVREFCAAASPQERAALAREWSQFVAQTQSQSLEEINQILTGPLGSSYILTSDEIQGITNILARHKARS